MHASLTGKALLLVLTGLAGSIHLTALADARNPVLTRSAGVGTFQVAVQIARPQQQRLQRRQC